MRRYILAGYLLAVWWVSLGFAQTDVLEQNPATQLTPQGDVIVGRIGGVPVYQIGQAFIYAVSPDFENDFSTQEGNAFPRVKIQPKKSWELKENRLGTSAPRVPRSLRMDFQPYQWFHLIDGDPNTYWCSHALNFSDQEEAWLRIDLAVPTPLKEIRIVARKDGLGIPGELTIKVSSDLRTWPMVYHTVSQLPPEPGGTLRFPLNYTDPVRAIWIIGNRMSLIGGWWYAREQYAFSIAEVEAIDAKGNNVALLSRGAGATVSSTYYGDGLTAEEHNLYWPIHFDLGDKWVRVNYWESVFQWCYVEPNEKGKYYIDPRADQAMTETVKNGANVIMALDYGNWLYDAETPRKNYTTRDWVEQHSKRLASLPTASPEALQGYLNYTRFMTRHFCDRVRYFEIWNEENGGHDVNYGWGETPEDAHEFMKLVKATAPVIRKECPKCKIMLGATGGFGLAQLDFIKACLDDGAGPLVDAIGFHPFYDTDLGSEYYTTFPQRIRELKTYAQGHGFKGEYMATENNWSLFPQLGFSYEHGGEMRQTKSILRTFVTNLGLGIYSLYCETWNTSFPWNLGLFRGTFASNPLSTVMPAASYYAFRTLATVMEEALPTEVGISFSGRQADYETFAFRRPSGEVMVSVALAGSTSDGPARRLKTTVSVKNLKAQKVTVIDLLNGFEQELRWEQKGNDLVVPDLNIPDYPVLIRLTL
jgi:hypothetical protein